MYGLKELKPKIFATDDTVECPVNGCTNIVKRQRKHFRRSREFLCPRHNIFVGPSTFEYLNEDENFLWHEREDRAFLDAVHRHKRESRMARDNSEDSLSWNIFRYLELADHLNPALSALCNIKVVDSQPTYWSYSHVTKSALHELDEARLEFGEELRRSSEPDLIVTSKSTVFWIEAKLNASNDTQPSSANQKRYTIGGRNWFHEVLNSDYCSVAVRAKRYELMRMWLLGSWMAKNMERNFVLINLVKRGREETHFASHIKESDARRFLCLTWEEIHAFITSHMTENTEKQHRVLTYMENKSIGYDGRGCLKAAFPTLRGPI
jgi:hypothetical protein